ncbi:hypothetical protein [Bradyrhizobium sp. CB3481]|uniref:hypothetical protein n=1 Tax=Bradyrhizobium sp. CB3481 TaxID=3039158 RepID=UPI0024B28069|nr:hypothetical protein [Bradyrhizobium sp. CB3481]WFU13917.1 hypothetical protein QA643_22040 [Bradyrhizobium sp. CB3481]
MPTLKDTDPHDVFAIESLLHAHAEKMPPAEKAPPLAHDPATPPAAAPVQVAPSISIGAPARQAEPTFSAPQTPEINVSREIGVKNDKASEIKVDRLKALDDRPMSKWVKRIFMALLGLVGAIAAAAWQHYGDDAKAMAAEWTPPFLLAALPSTAKPALAEQPVAPATETAVTDQAAQPATAAAAAPAQPESATTAAVAPAPSADTDQLQSMARDLAAMGQQVEELKSTIAQLKASQAQMARELAKASEVKAPAAVAPPPPVRPAAPPVRKPKPISSYSPSYSPAPMAAAPAAPPPVQVAAPPPPAPPRQTIADDGEPVVRPPMPLR